MKLYIYAKSGHNFGLENIRRSSAIYNSLKNLDPIFCSSDYRAATYAKSAMGVIKGVGIDVIGNLPHIMERADILIYDDSNESSSTMKEHMKDYCTQLYKMGEEIPFDIVDMSYFEKVPTKYEKVIFFADDDYCKWFLSLCQNSIKQDIPFLLGHYFFLGTEDIYKRYFSDIFEDEEYKDVVRSTKYLLTSSVHTLLESIASGKKPVYFKRKDKGLIENIELIEKYNIPIIDSDNLDDLIKAFEKVIQNYPSIKDIEKFNANDIFQKIDQVLEKHKHIKSALEFKEL
ncbi:MAG: hypothetical protein U9Q33_04120 [Campylobacterota bacterium]|nr:hypothetical protein [Campylobacterota bacterium]